MSRVCTAAEARALDRRMIDELGIPGIALMETASRGLAEIVRDQCAEQAGAGITVVCGPGNNGGDGFGAARWLHGWGLTVQTWALSPTSTGDAAVMREAARRVGVPEAEGIGRAGVIIDAVFGTGLSRPVHGEMESVLLRMDTHPAVVVAADIPSGLCSDTGRELGSSVAAAHTVTFGAYKRGLFCGRGPQQTGRIHLVELGDGDGPSDARLTTAAEVAALWPRRAVDDHKTRSGHLLVLAGSTPMAGAAVLTTLGALAAGAGLVTLCAPRGALCRLGALPPEVMVRIAGEGDVLELTGPPDVARYTAVAAGPGLGGGAPLPPHTEMALAALWAGARCPMVYDADALPTAQGTAAGPRLITPHPGEAARILGCAVPEVQADRFGAVRRLAGSAVVLLKGRHTLVADGACVHVNPTGHPVLATGGSGDVLTGVAGALLARGLSAVDAGRAAAWAHGRAGEYLAARREGGWTASDVAHAVPEVIKGPGFP